MNVGQEMIITLAFTRKETQLKEKKVRVTFSNDEMGRYKANMQGQYRDSKSWKLCSGWL